MTFKIKFNIHLDEDLIKRLRELEKKSLIRLAVHVDLALRAYLEKAEAQYK